MRKWCLIILGVFIISNGIAQCEFLVWADEFDGASLDEQKWGYAIGTGCPQLCGWGNGELQYYTNEEGNVNLQDGRLIITAKEESFEGSDYTSGRIQTKDLAAFASGRIEASIKLPEGQGLWPAFWMLPQEQVYGGWPLSGEIDIMEMLGQEPNVAHGTIHYGGQWPFNMYQGNSYNSPGSLTSDFHVYAVEWNESGIYWYVDEVLYSTKTADNLGDMPWRFDQNFYLLLNVAVGGYWPGYPDASTQFPQSMEVDYVRVYQDLEDTFVVGRDRVIAETPNENYHVPQVEDATYNWTVSEGEIISGQDTPEVLVNWGQVDGQVSCEVSVDGCTSVISKDVQVIAPDCEVLLHDSETLFECQWTGLDGQVYSDPVPSPNSVNSSANCLRYVRGTEINDQLHLGVDWMSDAGPFEAEEMMLAFDIYTNATAGQAVNLYFENQELAQASFPSGRHSVYSSQIEMQYEWHTLYFPYSFSPQDAMADNLVNQLTIYFAPAEQLAYTYYLDNIRVVHADCYTHVAEAPSASALIWPQPASGIVNFTFPSSLQWSLVNLSGQVVQSGFMQAQVVQSIELEPGIYFLFGEQNKQKSGQKIVVY